MTVPTCVVCQYRTPDYPQVCATCRSRIATTLADLAAAWHALSAEPGRRGSERITGTRDRPLGVALAVLDQMLPAGSAQAVRDVGGDQIGAVPVAMILDGWCRDIAERRDIRLPGVTVPELVAWLARHLDWVCEHHPAVDELATEVRACLYVCRAVMGDTPPRPTMCEGVACPTCDMRALYRIPGSSLIHCGACPHLMTEEEYHDAVKRQAARLAREP